jgi:hypothetical protein
MRSSLQLQEEVTKLHATEARCNLGVTEVQCSVRRLRSDEKVKATVRINPNSLIAQDKMLSTCWRKRSFVCISNLRSLKQSVSVLEDSQCL